MQRLIFCALPPHIAQVGVNLGLWDSLAARRGNAASVSELAKETGAEEELLARLLRYAATQWMVEQVGLDTFRASNVTHHLAMSGMKSVLFHVTRRNIGVYNSLPEWMERNEYKSPSNNSNLPFHLSKNTDLHFFDWLALHPDHQKAFNEYMAFQRVGQQSWLDVFPFSEHLKVRDPHRVLFVDVGGGHGHQCKGILEKYPFLSGRIVLEENDAGALESAKSIEGVEVLQHDFMKPQVVKGARVYYMRNILHDWPSEVCESILLHLKDALAPDSVILVDDLVLPDVGAPWYGASFDLLMMANYGSRERSVSEWDKIIGAVGLERQSLVRYTSHGDSIQVLGIGKVASKV
ncbi:hypothetical protein COCVIDRAFT_35854 [Neofusicoccum parvum]|uniref:Uncharacterized protein n=1 Tax=Neofusicoccum parvum TaxID=310453 RepID=A0ACB5SBF5_9PEZI|nr:hypothetical protein COCVIDRAFT_35854 [Neofusicoccum parvum]